MTKVKDVNKFKSIRVVSLLTNFKMIGYQKKMIKENFQPEEGIGCFFHLCKVLIDLKHIFKRLAVIPKSMVRTVSPIG